MALQARDYQGEAVEAGVATRREGCRSWIYLAPTGAGKCVRDDTLVWSAGLKTIREAYGAARIATPTGPRAVAGWYDDGARPGVRVTLECGLEIDGTPNHRVWTRDDAGGEGWKRLDAVTTADYVAVARGRADFGSHATPDDEAYALGLLVADGSIARVGASQRLQIDKQRPVLEAVAPVLARWRAWCGGISTRPPRIVERSPRHAFTTVCGPGFDAMLRDRYGFALLASEARATPGAVLRGTRAAVRAFLRGYFDGDGWCDKTVAVSTASSKLADQVNQMLLGLGVYTRRRRKPTSHLDAHVIEVRDPAAFAREVGFTPYGLTKDTTFARLTARARNSNVDVVPGLGPALRAAAQRVPDKQRRRDAWRHANAYYSSAKRPSYATLTELVAALPVCPERAPLAAALADHYAWSRVSAADVSVAHRLDCEVPDGHAFVGNGLVNHNTLVGALLALRALRRGHRVLALAHRGELLEQFYEKLRDDCDVAERDLGLVYGGARARLRPDARVQVASIASVTEAVAADAGLVLVDECHRAAGATYRREITRRRRRATVVGLTATPCRIDGKPLGDLFERIIVVARPRQLVAAGWLAEPRVFTVPAFRLPAVAGVPRRGGDFDAAALAAVVRAGTLVGDVVEHWGQRARGLRTLLFAADRAQSRAHVAALRGAGVRAVHVDGATPVAARRAAVADLRAGRIDVLANVDLFVEGLDVVECKCVVMAAPTLSLTRFLQRAGRCVRPWNDVTPVILDHGGDALRHGLPTDDREYTLDRPPPAAREPGADLEGERAKACPACYLVVEVYARACPACGHAFAADVRAARTVRTVAGELVELTRAALDERAAAWTRLWIKAHAEGYKPGWVDRQYERKFGELPPPHFAPLPRPAYTAEDRRRFVAKASGIAHRQGFDHAWVAARYEQKFGEAYGAPPGRPRAGLLA